MEQAVLVGIQIKSKAQALASIEELKELVRTAGAKVDKVFIQHLHRIEPSTFIGSGKVQEIKDYITSHDIQLVIFDENLSPSQEANLADTFERPVLDRTAVILDIFAKHARTKEGALQVELAQLRYRLPRLSGSKKYLSRPGGGIGTQGPGETQLEVDRRRIREKMDHLKKELESVRRHRDIYRQKRKGVPIPVVSLIGYTNAGKSTLLNALCGETVVRAEDKLFATLDPTTRRIELPNRQTVLVTDTVGFIKKLPHHLVEAFKATFEEVSESDLLIHVIDGAHPSFSDQAETVMEVLKEIDVFQIPILHVYNKLDLFEKDKGRFLVNSKLFPSILISAEKKMNIDELLLKIQDMLSRFVEEIELKVSMKEAQKIRAFISEHGKILGEKVEDDFLHLKATVTKKAAQFLKKTV